MDINYYDEHQEEFEAVKLALKGEMERIWGSMLKESGDSLDDEATYLNLFEELQYTFSPSSFSKLTPSQDLDEDKIAAKPETIILPTPGKISRRQERHFLFRTPDIPLKTQCY